MSRFQNMFGWLFRLSQKRSRALRRRSAQLCLDALEDRMLPSASLLADHLHSAKKMAQASPADLSHKVIQSVEVARVQVSLSAGVGKKLVGALPVNARRPSVTPPIAAPAGHTLQSLTGDAHTGQTHSPLGVSKDPVQALADAHRPPAGPLQSLAKATPEMLASLGLPYHATSSSQGAANGQVHHGSPTVRADGDQSRDTPTVELSPGEAWIPKEVAQQAPGIDPIEIWLTFKGERADGTESGGLSDSGIVTNPSNSGEQVIVDASSGGIIVDLSDGFWTGYYPKPDESPDAVHIDLNDPIARLALGRLQATRGIGGLHPGVIDPAFEGSGHSLSGSPRKLTTAVADPMADRALKMGGDLLPGIHTPWAGRVDPAENQAVAGGLSARILSLMDRVNSPTHTVGDVVAAATSHLPPTGPSASADARGTGDSGPRDPRRP